MSKSKILAIGELLADLISSNEVQDLSQVKSFEMYQGGSPANLCANLNWLGQTCEMMACVGKDGIGDFLIDAIASIGINTKWIQQIENIPTSLVLVGRSKSSPEFIAYRQADRFIKLPTHFSIEEFNTIHTSAFALSLNPARTTILNLFKEAQKRKFYTSIDWNFAAQIWGNDKGIEVFECLMGNQTLLKLSLDDCGRFTQNKIQNAKDAMSWVSQYNFKTCVITCGAEGVRYANADKVWHYLPALPVKEVVDTTGAGDAFWAGFLAEWSKTQNTELSVMNGLKIASQKIQRMGPLYL